MPGVLSEFRFTPRLQLLSPHPHPPPSRVAHRLDIRARRCGSGLSKCVRSSDLPDFCDLPVALTDQKREDR